MPLGLLCSVASRPLSRSRRCRLQLKVSPREPVKLVVVLTGHTAGEPVVMHPRVWDHEVPLVMSQVIQATGQRIVHTWVWLHLLLTFIYSGEPLFCSAWT